ncbi:hypothetical protein CSUI_002514 [Cystoisospora suis]|uniref:Uncharacterized protein n=1 Tax=Cystoisospora suis TaxID=483139 RepID=A0A2C6L983_9APIC|nr:hypothetical protein CSUI_002514 [Cystoisospora suis]
MRNHSISQWLTRCRRFRIHKGFDSRKHVVHNDIRNRVEDWITLDVLNEVCCNLVMSVSF